MGNVPRRPDDGVGRNRGKKNVKGASKTAIEMKVSMLLDVSAALLENERRSRLLVDAVQDYAIYMLDTEGRVTTWNKGAERIKGYDGTEILGRHFSCFFPPEDIAADTPNKSLRAAKESGHFAGEGWRVRKDGSRLWASVVIDPIYDEQGEVIGYAKVTRDLTERKRQQDELLASEAALEAEKERLQITLESIADGVICTDESGNITIMNPAAESMTGWKLAQATGRPIEEVLHLANPDGDVAVHSPVRECLAFNKVSHLQEGAILLALDGARRDIQDSVAPIRTADGQMIGSILVFQDITALRTIQREVEFHTTHDALTLLPDRKQFESLLEDTIRRVTDTGCVVCFLDLDRFKVVNDTAGHAAGDVLIKTVTHLLIRSVRASDLVARLGGDEFAIILHDRSEFEALDTLTKILEAIEAMHFGWEDRGFRITASLGVVAITPASEVPMVMQQADVACYAAKRAGRNRISVYRPEVGEGHERHLEIQVAADIRDAISEDRCSLFAQKVVAIGEPCAPHYELLLRMWNRGGEMMSPAGFIPVAERYDLMANLDRWVLERALHYHGPRLLAIPGVQICVNLSANSLNEPKFLPFILDVVRNSPLPPTALTLEITETALINNLSTAGIVIEKLRSAGCKVALDDFGIGLCSFSYLRNFKVDFIKIEGSFVRNIAHSAVDLAIVRAINNIAHEIHSQTIAEYVENEAILEIIKKLGVDFAQGYLLGRPEPIENIFI
jgi:diguanylate cyclase (GGDEF)-like protein/PAS domain S-box-containing protein